MLTRLQKYLADCGVASRRAAEKLITSGQVKVNGQVVAILGAKVDQEKDKVEYRGQVVSPQPRHIYIILNKPVGYLSACSAKKGEKTVLDLVKVPERIFPVGRLDKDSEGLLLLTNDGEFAHKLMHPSFEHEKEYVVAVHEKVSPRQISHLRDGVLLEDGKTYPARVKQLGAKEFSVTTHEGRNRQIRRMCEAVGLTVLGLRRVRVGKLMLGKLTAGQWKEIDARKVWRSDR